MNLKERGITVGDLLIASIFIISTIFIVNNIKENDTKSNILINNDIKIAQKNI